MLEKYKGKEVRMLVSSDSGAGIGTGSSHTATMSSIITITGTINDLDNNFLEIQNSKLSYIDAYSKVSHSFNNKKEFEPTEFENDITLVNIDKVVSISII